MIVQENDRRVIPEKYLKMSTAEIEQEKKKLLEEMKSRPTVLPNHTKKEAPSGLVKF